MFPLEFPLRVLSRGGTKGQVVLDPFAGRGTTLFAARLTGMQSYGIDSNPVAAAISESKLVNVEAWHVIKAAKKLLSEFPEPSSVPSGEFWQWAFHPATLKDVCRLREGLLKNCASASHKALRALLLGALHGPLTKSDPSYFSNQCTRTYAPKPRYALNFWKTRGLHPPCVDTLALIKRRADRFFTTQPPKVSGAVALEDSTKPAAFEFLQDEVDWIITSPPYYGMRTYIPDQWLRRWFLGGPAEVDYSNERQLSHASQDVFSTGLKTIWQNCARVAKPGARLVIRFGAINDRKLNPLDLLKESLAETRWRIQTARNAGSACSGKRQANHFSASVRSAIPEYDIWAIRN